MIIAKELPIGKQDSNTCIATSSLGVGNIVPHWWYKEIRATGDKPDLVAITILSELYFLYRKNNGAEFNDGYTYFERKFDFTRSQLKDAIIRLDNKGLAYRSFRTIVVKIKTTVCGAVIVSCVKSPLASSSVGAYKKPITSNNTVNIKLITRTSRSDPDIAAV